MMNLVKWLIFVRAAVRVWSPALTIWPIFRSFGSVTEDEGGSVELVDVQTALK